MLFMIFRSEYTHILLHIQVSLTVWNLIIWTCCLNSRKRGCGRKGIPVCTCAHVALCYCLFYWRRMLYIYSVSWLNQLHSPSQLEYSSSSCWLHLWHRGTIFYSPMEGHLHRVQYFDATNNDAIVCLYIRPMYWRCYFSKWNFIISCFIQPSLLHTHSGQLTGYSLPVTACGILVGWFLFCCCCLLDPEYSGLLYFYFSSKYLTRGPGPAFWKTLGLRHWRKPRWALRGSSGALNYSPGMMAPWSCEHRALGTLIWNSSRLNNFLPKWQLSCIISLKNCTYKL